MVEKQTEWQFGRLQKPSGSKRLVELSEIDEIVSSGTFGKIEKIRARVRASALRGGGYIEVPLVSKEYFNPMYKDTDPETEETAEGRATRALKAYEMCKQAGIPVPGIARMELGEKRVRLIASDLSEREKYLVLSCNNRNKEVHDKSISAIKNLDDLIAHAIKIAIHAGQHKIFLPQDAYFFMLRSNNYKQIKEAIFEKIVIGDFDLVMIDETAADQVGLERRALANAKIAIATLRILIDKFVTSPEPADIYFKHLDKCKRRLEEEWPNRKNSSVNKRLSSNVICQSAAHG